MKDAETQTENVGEMIEINVTIQDLQNEINKLQKQNSNGLQNIAYSW